MDIDSGGREGMVNHMNDEWDRASVVSSELLVGWNVYSRTENRKISEAGHGLGNAIRCLRRPHHSESSSDYPADSASVSFSAG